MAAGYAFVVRNVSIQRGKIQGDKEGLMLGGGGGWGTTGINRALCY